MDRRRFLSSILIGSFLPYPSSRADSFDDISAGIDAMFEDVSVSIDAQYALIDKEVEQAYRQLEAEIAQSWGTDNVKMPTKKQWVDYSDDRSLRREFDFEEGVLRVEAVVEKGKPVSEVVARLDKAVLDAVVDTEKTLAEKDAALKIANVKLQEQGIDIDNSDELPDEKPVLNGIVSKDSAENIIKKGPDTKIKVSGEKQIVNYTIPFTTGHYSKLAKRYAKTIFLNAKKHNVPASLILAVMQTESAFNPRARSHIPAYGLMQLVPRSGAMDSYRHIYGEKKLLGPDYLYSPEKNIELGTGYLNLVFSKYLSPITDKSSRWHCTVAAYNTGAGNVAKAFGQRRVRAASNVINKMSSDEVYQHLQKNLPYDETKHYVVKVERARKHYLSWDKV